MFKELDIIALTSPIARERIWDLPGDSILDRINGPNEGLRIGDVGTIVYVQGDGEAYEVEFLEPGGRTVAIATILASQARRAGKEDIANCRFGRKPVSEATKVAAETGPES